MFVSDLNKIERALNDSRVYNETVGIYVKRNGNRGISHFSNTRERDGIPCETGVEKWGDAYASGYIEVTSAFQNKKAQKEMLSCPIPFEIGKIKALDFMDKMRAEINQLVSDLRHEGNEISYIGDFLIDGFCIAEWLCSGQVSRVDKALWSISDCGSRMFHSREFVKYNKNEWMRMIEPYATSRLFIIDFDKGTLSRMSFEECYKVMMNASKAKR